MTQKISPKLLTLVFSVLVLCFLATIYIFAWTEPGSAPPTGNVIAPLNTSSTAQTKTGNLTFPIFYDSNNTSYYVNPASTYSAILAGRVGIGTTTPGVPLQVESGSIVVRGFSNVGASSLEGMELGYILTSDVGVIRTAYPDGVFVPLDIQASAVRIGPFIPSAVLIPDRPFLVVGTIGLFRHTATFEGDAASDNWRRGIAIGELRESNDPANIYRSIQAFNRNYSTGAVTWENLLINKYGGNVGIRTGSTAPGGALRVNTDASGNANYFQVNGDTNVGVELRSGTALGTPYIDFSNDNASDYDMRIILTNDNTLTVTGGNLSHTDIAENIPVSTQGLEGGDVVIIDKENRDKLEKSTQAYDILVAGVISETPTFLIGGDKLGLPVALAGRVNCKVTTENGPIEIGDLLVTSSKPGYAMKADSDKVKPGMIIGKALESLEKGEGKILILVD